MTNKSIRDYINLIESIQRGNTGSEPDAYGNTGEKHECGSCDGTGIDQHDEVCPVCGGKGWVRDKEDMAEGSAQKPSIAYKDYTFQYDYQTEDDDPEGYSTATTYHFDVLKDGKHVGEAEYFDYFGDLTIRINGKTKKYEHQHPLASQISELVSSLPEEQKKDLSDPRFESQGVAEEQLDETTPEAIKKINELTRR